MFTDEDLHSLKQRLNSSKYSVSYRAVIGLVERLEAAEKVCEHMVRNVYVDKWPMLKEWLQKCGKETDVSKPKRED